jgi:hypothetical protein
LPTEVDSHVERIREFNRKRKDYALAHSSEQLNRRAKPENGNRNLSPQGSNQRYYSEVIEPRQNLGSNKINPTKDINRKAQDDMTSNLKPQKNPIRLATKADHDRIKAIGNSPIQKRALKISQKPSLPNKLDKDLYLSDVTKTHGSRSKTGDTKKRNKDNPDKIDKQSKKKPVLKLSNDVSKIKPDFTDRNSIPSGTRKNKSPKKIDLDNTKPCKRFTDKSLSISRSVSASNSFGKGRKTKKLTDNLTKQKPLDIDSTSKRPKQTSEAKDQNVNIKGKTRPSKADQQDKHADSKRFKDIGSNKLLGRKSQPHSTKAQPKTHIDRPKVKGSRQQQANQEYQSTADHRSKHQVPLKDRAESRSRYSHTHGLHEDSEDKAFSLKPLSDSSESDQKDNGLNESRSSKGYPMRASDHSSRRPATDRRSVTFPDNMRSNPPSERGKRERSSPRFKDQAIEDVYHIRRNRPSKENDIRLKPFYKSQTQSGPSTGRKYKDFIQSSSSRRESQHSNDRQPRNHNFKKQHENIANKRVQSLDSKDSYINESRSRGEMRVSDNMKNILHNDQLRRNRDPHTLNDIHGDQLHEAALNNLQGPTFGDLRHSRLTDTRPLTSSNFQIYEQFPSVQNYSRLVDKAIQAMEPYRNSNMNNAVHGRSEEKFCQTDSLAEVSPSLTFQQLPSQHLLSRTASPSVTGIKSSQRLASVSEEEMGSTVRLALEGWQHDKDRLAKAEDAIRGLQAESRGLADELEERRTREDRLIQAVKELEEILEEKDEAQKCFAQELDQRENLIQKVV